MRRSRFFGRDGELTKLANLIADHRLVTVTGTGGVGKTRLVEEVRPFLREVYGDEVVLVSLADVDATVDASVISAKLGLDSPEAFALSHRDGSAVVVLDNCEHVAGAAADFVVRLLAAGDAVSVVATSRVPLGLPDEQLLVVDPLDLPSADDAEPLRSPSAALFVERSEASGGRWDRTDEAIAAVCEICRRVDGLPLAIELAASRTRALSPTEILTLMERRLDTLQAPQPGRPARHRSVRAAIDVSIDALDDEAAAFFDRVGVFAGSFDLHLAHAVAGPCQEDRLRTIDIVGQLVDASLLVPESAGDQTRYRLLELVREYCIESLRETGAWESANERLTDVMVGEADRLLATAATRWSGDVVRDLSDRFCDFDQAVRWCIEHDVTAARAQRLFVALYVGIHLSWSGAVRALGEQLLAHWLETDAPLRGEVLAVLATAHTMASLHGRGAELAAMALATPDVSDLGRVIAHRAAMLAAVGIGDLEAARDHAEQGRTDAARAGVAPFERELQSFEASLLDRLGHHDDAVALVDEATRASLDAGDTITEVWARLVAATIATRAQRCDEARTQLEAARNTSVAAKDLWWGGPMLRAEGYLRAIDSDRTESWEASRPTWRRAVERAAARGDLGELALSLRAAALVAARADRPDIVDALLDAVPAANETTVLPSPFDESRPLRTLKQTERRATDSIVASLRRALVVLGDDSDEAPPTAAPQSLGAVLQQQGDFWTISYKGRRVQVRDLKGLNDLAVLLSRPGQEIHCLEMMGAGHVQDSTGPALDGRARKEYQDRIIDLQGEIDDAHTANDTARAERAEIELDALVQQLSEAFGIGGRARARGSSAERARTAVTYRVRAAIRRIADVHPELARHLDNAVRTGTWCSYKPDVDIAWRVERS